MDDYSDYSHSFGDPCTGCGADSFGQCTQCKEGLCFFCAEGGIGSPALCPKCAKKGMKKINVANNNQTPPGYGAHIQIDGPEYDLPEEIRSFLASQTIWGGNTSNTPKEYSHWEMTQEKFEEACAFLRRKGYSLSSPTVR